MDSDINSRINVVVDMYYIVIFGYKMSLNNYILFTPLDAFPWGIHLKHKTIHYNI